MNKLKLFILNIIIGRTNTPVPVLGADQEERYVRYFLSKKVVVRDYGVMELAALCILSNGPESAKTKPRGSQVQFSR